MEDYIIELWNSQYNIEDISEETGVDETTVYEILEENGLL